MRVAVAGAGNVGRSIAELADENGHEVLLLESSPTVAAKITPVEGIDLASATPARCRR